MRMRKNGHGDEFLKKSGVLQGQMQACTWLEETCAEPCAKKLELLVPYLIGYVPFKMDSL
jgi:hypothetical protein